MEEQTYCVEKQFTKSDIQYSKRIWLSCKKHRPELLWTPLGWFKQWRRQCMTSLHCLGIRTTRWVKADISAQKWINANWFVINTQPIYRFGVQSDINIMYCIYNSEGVISLQCCHVYKCTVLWWYSKQRNVTLFIHVAKL